MSAKGSEVVDLGSIAERWVAVDQNGEGRISAKREWPPELYRLVFADVPAMMAELDQHRAGIKEAIEALRLMLDDGQLLASYIAGVTKTGAGQRDTASNMVQAFDAACARGRVLLKQLETVQHDTAGRSPIRGASSTSR